LADWPICGKTKPLHSPSPILRLRSQAILNRMNVQLEKTILWLGYGGLLPFVGLALLIWLVPARHEAAMALGLVAYGPRGAGGTHHGFAGLLRG